MAIDLCDQCGYRQPFESPPAPPTKPRKNTKPTLDQNAQMAIVAAVLALIGVITINISHATKTAQEKQVDAITAIVNDEESPEIDIADLPEQCRPRDTINMTINVVNQCLPMGLTISQLQQISGQPGELVAKSDLTEIRQHRESVPPGDGILMVTFANGKLVSYSQMGFNPNPPEWSR